MHLFQYSTMCLQLSTLKKKTAFVRLAQAVNDMPQKLIKDKIHFFLANRAGVKWPRLN